jgi:hypothetical protein
MSVVYIPEDTRWKDMGQGIGQLVGAFVSRKLIDSDNRRVLQGIHDINVDESISPQDKATEVGMRFGQKGLAMTQALEKMRAEQVLTQERQAQTGLAQTRQRQIETMTPGAQQEQALRTQKTAGEVAMQPAEAELKAAQTAHAQAGTASELAGIPGKTAEGQIKAGEAADQAAQRQALIRLYTADPDGTSAALGVTTEQLHGILLGGALGGPKAAASGIEGAARTQGQTAQIAPRAEARIGAEQKAKEGTQPLPPALANTVGNSARLAEGLDETLKGVIGNPKSQGGVTAYVKSRLAEHGLMQADPAFAQQLANTHQLVAQAAGSLKGFMSAQSIGLAKTISPSVLVGKVLDVFEAHAQASDQLAYLENQRGNFTPQGKPTQHNLTAMDDAIGKLRKIKDYTGGLWSTVDNKVYWQGKEVNPNTLEPVKGGSQEVPAKTKVDLGGGNWVDGEQINRQARTAGVTPEQAVEISKAIGKGEVPEEAVKRVTGHKPRPPVEVPQ